MQLQTIKEQPNRCKSYLKNTMLGMLATPLSLITLGKIKYINDISNMTQYSNDIFPCLYKKIIKKINPNFSYKNYYRTLSLKQREYKNIGSITSIMATPIFESAHKNAIPYKTMHSKIKVKGAKKIYREEIIYVRKNSFFERHFISRALFALGTLTALITRTVDCIFALFKIMSSITSPAKKDKIYIYFLKNLSTYPGIINDICIGLRGILNPLQFSYIKE